MTATPGDDLTFPNPTMTPMLHQATPADNPEEFTDDAENKENDNKHSEKEQTNGQSRKGREEQQTKFIENTTLDDVHVDDSVNNKVGKKETDTTHLVSIKGCCPKKLSMTCLRKFCMVHSISGYKALAKTGLCNLIVERMKTRGLDSNMYPDDFQKAEKAEKIKKLSKNAKPPAVTRDGSFWRAISTYFLQSLRPHVIKLGNNPDIQKIDARKFLHEDIWVLLAEAYNDDDHADLQTFLKNDTFYEACRIPEDIVQDYDILSPLELSQLMSHIHHHYRGKMRIKNSSGHHDGFTTYCGTRPWLLLYHKSIQESSIEMKTFVSGNLPDGVGGSSLKKKRDIFADDTDSDNEEKGKKPRRQPRGTKGASEKMRVALAMEAFGKAAKERTSIMKGQAKQIAGINSAEAYGKFKNKVREGRADLRALRKESFYDSASSETKELKETIKFFKGEARCIFEELELQKKQIQIQQQPSTITTESLSRQCSTLSGSEGEGGDNEDMDIYS
jgi:hypothetical protein